MHLGFFIIFAFHFLQSVTKRLCPVLVAHRMEHFQLLLSTMYRTIHGNVCTFFWLGLANESKSFSRHSICADHHQSMLFSNDFLFKFEKKKRTNPNYFYWMPLYFIHSLMLTNRDVWKLHLIISIVVERQSGKFHRKCSIHSTHSELDLIKCFAKFWWFLLSLSLQMWFGIYGHLFGSAILWSSWFDQFTVWRTILRSKSSSTAHIIISSYRFIVFHWQERDDHGIVYRSILIYKCLYVPILIVRNSLSNFVFLLSNIPEKIFAVFFSQQPE